MGLSSGVQKFLYFMSLIVNVIVRLFFGWVFWTLWESGQFIYSYIFAGLWAAVVVIYFIIMVKFLYTKSDPQSVYMQK
jgi:hypothetical protein